MNFYVIRRTSFAALGIAALAASCASADETSGGGSGADDDDPIVIGTLQSVTGPSAYVGDKMRQGAELAIEQLREDGGIAGRDVEWEFYDPQGDTSTAVQQARRMVDDGIDVLAGGGSNSGIALAVLPITEAADTLFIATEGAREIVEPIEERPLTFKAAHDDTEIVERTIDFWQARDIDNVAFLPDTTSFGQSALEQLQEQAPEAGITYNTAEFDPGATDLGPQISRLASEGPDAYLGWTTAASGVTLIQNVRSLVDEDVLVQHGFGFVDDRYMEQAGQAGVGTILSSPPLPVFDLLDESPQVEFMADFAEAFEERYSEAPNVFAGEGYDAVLLAAEAIEHTGGDTDGPALAQALEQMEPFIGVTGTYDFSDERHTGLGTDSVHMIEWDGDRFVLADE